MFEKSVSRYIEQLVGFTTTKAREIKQRETAPAMQTPTFSFGGPTVPSGKGKKVSKKGEGRRMRFDEESIQKFHQRNRQEHVSHDEHAGFGMPPEETPKTTKPSKVNIEDQEICLFIMKILNKALITFHNTFVESEYKSQRVVLDFWVTYVKLMSLFVSNASAEILKGVLETIDFVLNSELDYYFYEKYDSVTLGLFEEINSVIQRKTDLVLTLQVTELLVKIYKMVFTKQNVENKPQLLNPQNLNVALHILRVNLINARPTIGLNAMRQDNVLKDEEKLIFDFIDTLGELLHENDDALKYYLSFLLNFINYDPNEPHYETFVQKIFEMITNGICNDYYSPGILFELMPELYSKTSEIVDLRYDNDACMSLIFSMKSGYSLFENAGMFLLKITSHILDKNVEEPTSETKLKEPKSGGIKKSNLQIDISDDEENEEESKAKDDSAKIDENVDEKGSDEEITAPPDAFSINKSKASKKTFDTSLRAIDEEDSIMMSPTRFKIPNANIQNVQEIILSKIMDIIKDVLLFNIGKIQKHNKAVKDDVIKSSQDLDVQVINFIINSLLPHANKLGKKFEHTLVSIIDNGCNGYLDTMSTSGLNMFGSSSTVLVQSNSLSTYCFDNLFELCSYKKDAGNINKTEKLESIKRKIAKTTTPILLERCKDTLHKFLYDEMKSGTMLMGQQRAKEVVFILEKLKNLDVYPNLLNEIVEDNKDQELPEEQKLSEAQLETRKESLKSVKGHLFYFIPLFSEFITSKEELIKDALKDIFLELALANGIHEKLTLSSGTSNELNLF